MLYQISVSNFYFNTVYIYILQKARVSEQCKLPLSNESPIKYDSKKTRLQGSLQYFLSIVHNLTN